MSPLQQLRLTPYAADTRALRMDLVLRAPPVPKTSVRILTPFSVSMLTKFDRFYKTNNRFVIYAEMLHLLTSCGVKK